MRAEINAEIVHSLPQNITLGRSHLRQQRLYLYLHNSLSAFFLQWRDAALEVTDEVQAHMYQGSLTNSNYILRSADVEINVIALNRSSSTGF